MPIQTDHTTHPVPANPPLHEDHQNSHNHESRQMNYHIDIKKIADTARRDFRIGGDGDGKELYDATAADISDYVMFAIGEYMEVVSDSLSQELQEIVEREITHGF